MRVSYIMPARSAEIFFLYPGAPARVVAFCDRVAITHPQGVRDFQLLQIKKSLGVFVKDLLFDAIREHRVIADVL